MRRNRLSSPAPIAPKSCKDSRAVAPLTYNSHFRTAKRAMRAVFAPGATDRRRPDRAPVRCTVRGESQAPAAPKSSPRMQQPVRRAPPKHSGQRSAASNLSIPYIRSKTSRDQKAKTPGLNIIEPRGNLLGVLALFRNLVTISELFRPADPWSVSRGVLCSPHRILTKEGTKP
jgi:hypothetical protein